MGIRFSCPNGHRLHVKAFLAGKRAKCPQCGAKVRVPTGSNGADPREDDAPVLPSTDVNPSFAIELEETASTLEPSDRSGGTWFVRLPDGEQFGPIRTEDLADWVRQGRVPSEGWVWREGWTDWQPASTGLPDLLASPSPAPPPLPSPSPVPSPLRPPPPSILAPPVEPVHFPSSDDPRSQRWKRNKHEQNILVSGILGVATVILLVILVWILVKAN